MSYRSFVAVSLALVLGVIAACSADDEVLPGHADAAGPDAAPADARPAADAALVSTDPTVEPGCTYDGCVRRFEEVLVLTVADIIDLINNPDVVIENGATAYQITYMSDGRQITGDGAGSR